MTPTAILWIWNGIEKPKREKTMTKRTKEILNRLDQAYGTDTICYLNYETPCSC